MKYADYSYYVTEFNGVLITDSSEFDRLVQKASVDIDYYTFGRAKNNAELDSVKMAACAVADEYLIIERASASAATGELQSESVGSYSRTYRSSADSVLSARASIKDAINRYLGVSGLLSRGVPMCTLHML